MLTVLTAGAASGRIIPVKPTVSHTGTGQFTITNYNSQFNYTVTATDGTVSRSGAVITASSANTVLTISASSPKGGTANSATAERKAYTYTTPYFVQTGNFYTYNGPCNVGATCYGTCGPGTNNCGVTPGYTTCCQKDGTPGGYIDQHGEWSKVA